MKAGSRVVELLKEEFPDTHVRRVARRLGLTGSDDPKWIEADLEEQVHRSEWIGFSMRLILHGRRVCAARNPHCVSPVCARIGL